VGKDIVVNQLLSIWRGRQFGPHLDRGFHKFLSIGVSRMMMGMLARLGGPITAYFGVLRK
jgi:hypothetical protein